MKNNKPLVTVIVPIYNSEKFLSKCIESILSQTYTNIELILINDRSKDKTLHICKRYQKKDPRIVLINNKTNQGTLISRKRAILKAKGKFTMFVDSDDYIKENAIETILNHRDEKHDLIIFNMAYFKSGFYYYNFLTFDGSINDFYENISKFYNSIYLDPVCNKFYRTEKLKLCLNGIKEKVIMGEDLRFNIEYFKQCKNLKIIDNVIYYYNKGNLNSITTNCYPDLYKDEFSVINKCSEFFLANCHDNLSRQVILKDKMDKIIYTILRYINATNFKFTEKMNYLKKIAQSCKSFDCVEESLYSQKIYKEVIYLLKNSQYAGIYYLFKNLNKK